MTITISPFLRNQLNNNRRSNNTTNHHEKIYEDLKQHANDVKPNDAKAKLVKQNPISGTASAIKDNFNDGLNFFKAAKTGKMNDNNLGRINDLGMKAGALLIATFLATHAKTKTEALMQFIGGTTFFASMALWPKIFINLPARIIHGFPIDEKYISAQGDKKDLYLDNQFIPTGLHSKKQKEREMKRMGINPNELNAEEKWFRKRQKTALQNRTLWMATAGFATPLMTALVGNYVQPKVENAVIEHEFKKVKDILSDDNALNNYLIKQQDLSNAEALEHLFTQVKGKKLDDEFYKKLAELLQIGDLSQNMKDKDNWKPLESLKSNKLIEALKELQEQKSIVDEESLRELLENTHQATGAALKLNGPKTKLSEETINSIIEQLGENKTLENLRKVLNSKETKKQLGDEQIKAILNEVKTDNEEFFKAIREYDKNFLSKIKGRIKGFLDLMNPVVGSKSESIYTKQYNDLMSEISKRLGITKYQDLKKIKKQGNSAATKLLQEKIQELIAQDKNYIDGFNKFVDITTSHLGDRNLQSFENDIRAAFGDNFPLLRDRKKLEDFLKYVKSADESNTKLLPENKTWLMQIFEDYSTTEQSAPKKASIDVLNFEGITGNKKEASNKLGETSSLMKIFNAGTQDETYFKKLDNLTNAINAYLSEKNTNYNQAKDTLRETLKSILGEEHPIIRFDREFENFAQHIKKDNYVWINEILSGSKADQILTSQILGGKEQPSHLFNLLSRYIKNKNTDIDYTRAKLMICANFERRAKEGFFDAFEKDEIEAITNFLYDGTISDAINNLQIPNKDTGKSILEAVFDPSVFKSEEKVMPGISNIIESLKSLGSEANNFTERTLKANSLSDQFKTYATRLYNNKTWMRIFAPMAIGLVAVTLLVQPFFGNIKKEFPEDKRSGGAK